MIIKTIKKGSAPSSAAAVPLFQAFGLALSPEHQRQGRDKQGPFSRLVLHTHGMDTIRGIK